MNEGSKARVRWKVWVRVVFLLAFRGVVLYCCSRKWVDFETPAVSHIEESCVRVCACADFVVAAECRGAPNSSFFLSLFSRVSATPKIIHHVAAS